MSRVTSRFAPAAVFRPVHEPEALSPDLRLPSSSWGVLFSVTGRHTVAQLGSTLGVERAALEIALQDLIERGLIVERTLSIEEYLAAAATAGDTESVSLSRFLRARGPASEADRVDAAAGIRALSPAVDEPPFEPLPPIEVEETLMSSGPHGLRRLSLRSLIQLLMSRAETPDAGQLDVYRTFLRIDPALLRRQGITTLRLEDDRVVSEPELVSAIVDSARQTLAGPIPESVYVG